MKVTPTTFNATMIAAVVILVALVAAEVALNIAGKTDVTITNIVGYAIPALIGFIIGAPLTKGA